MAPSKRYTNLSLSSLITQFKFSIIAIFVLMLILGGRECCEASSVAYDVYATTMYWDHVIDLNEDFRILWTISNQDVTFEVRARTLGYVGFGFSADGNPNGADVAIGWIEKGHTYFQDRYVKPHGTPEPQVDPSQDYILIMGYENATHTVVRFRRKLNTCDSLHDIAITNSTMRVVYLYSDEDPMHGTVSPGLQNVMEAWRPYRSLLITQKYKPQLPRNKERQSLELRNQDVELPYGDDTLLWCKVFKLDKIKQKHHIVRYEPIYDSSWSLHYLRRITIYECHGNTVQMEHIAKYGRMCAGGMRETSLACNTIVLSWTKGSDGFTFPPEVGYPLEPNQARYYLMETYYSNLNADFEQFRVKQISDNSGIRIYYTANLRAHDGAVLSIGVDPNWRHIIPPGQKRVISEGQCLEECTGYAFPAGGIHIFAALFRTHQIARDVKLSQIRKTKELPPISHDTNVDKDYQDIRLISPTVTVLPGDRLVAECIYDTSSRHAITLGGLSMKEESCNVLSYYYPRQERLTTCHSLPSLPTLLQSLGIQQLAPNSNPVVISSPTELAGMTLEQLLLSYNWANQFSKFQRTTLRGSFKPVCWGMQGLRLLLSENLIRRNRNIIEPYKGPRLCKSKRFFVTEAVSQLELPVFRGIESNNIIGGSVQSSSSSFVETLALSGTESSARTSNTPHSYVTLFALVIMLIFR